MNSHRFTWPRLLALSGGGLFLGATAIHSLAQTPKTIESTAQVHVVEVAPLEPNPQRLSALKLPSGFFIKKFAELENPRMIAVAPSGNVYVSQRDSGTLVLLKDLNRDGRADVQKIVATRKVLHGIAINGNKLYFITIRDLYVANIKPDGTLTTPRLLINDLPDAGQHPNRTIAFGPDGKLYISCGSTTNAATERNAENASMLVADANGKNRKIFASGLRNTIGFGWHPTTKRFYGWDQGIDWLGDDGQREEINEIKMGKRYGWPYIYENGKVNPHPKPPEAYTVEDWKRMSTNPVLTYTAHAAGMQMAFYTGNQFPAEYKNDAFIPMRGSWNRKPPSGYELLRIHFDQKGNVLWARPFLTGFLLPTGAPGGKPGHIGRLAGVAMMKDGSMLLSDDTNNIVYRISYGMGNIRRMYSTVLENRRITLDLPETAKAPQSIVVKSLTFNNGGKIPFKNTAYDKNVTPQLSWSNIPKGTKSLVLMMEDPDAVSPKPFTHWLVANISPTTKGFKSGLPDSEMLGTARQGAANTSKTSYYGPKPPAGSGLHQYHFQVFALDTMLNLPSGYNRQYLVDAIKGHVLAKGETVGTYER